MLTRPETANREDVISALRRLIEAGEYAPGDRLPPERELIVSLGVTRATLRRALEAMEHEGAIWRHVGKGTFVSSTGTSATGGGLAELTENVSPADMMRARLSLEPAIAREAAINACGKGVARVKMARDRAYEATDWDEYEAQDDVFHRAVAQATRNQLLLALFDQLNQVRRAVAWKSVVRKTARPAREHRSFAEHDAIAAAIEARDPAAAHAAMRTHLNSVSGRLFEDDAL